MKQYFGNYLGIVITGGKDDPAGRGRCQVFIPHIMPALYESWNEEGEDVNFDIVGGGLSTALNTEVVDRLKKILPWAECAAPVVGAAPSTWVDSSGQANEVYRNMGTTGDSVAQEDTGTTTDGDVIAYTGNSGQSTGAHLDVRWKDKRSITAADADKYLRIDGKSPSSYGVTSKYGPRKLFGRSFHYGIDFGTPSGSAVTLTGGATFSTNRGNTGAGGVVAEITTPEGTMQLLHLSSVTKNSITENPSSIATGPIDVGSNMKSDGESAGQYEESQTTETETSTSADTTGESLSTRFTAYSPQRKGSSSIGLEGGYESSRPGLDGQSVVRTLQDVASGTSSYVTLAGDSSTYGQKYIIPSITFTNANNQTQTLTNVVGVVHDTGSAFKGAGTSKFDIAVDKDMSASQLNSQSFLNNNGAVTLAATNDSEIETLVSTSTSKTVQHPTSRPASPGPDTNYQSYGMFGYASTGAVVWVFFQEGNPLFPVYFAASYGQKEWQSRYRYGSGAVGAGTGTTDDQTGALKGTEGTDIGLYGGGVRSHFTTDESKFGPNFTLEIYGKNGSNLVFAKDFTEFNSVYNYNQRVAGDYHDITEANKEVRVKGDYNTYTEQDLIITVGNWSDEAVAASDEIQEYINEAMKIKTDAGKKS